MTNDEMLSLVQKDRPYQRIREVTGFMEIEPNNFIVTVIMEMCVGGNWQELHENIVYPFLKPGTNVLNLPHYN